ncbi:MAG: ATP-binding protein [bacterium]
MLDAGFRISGIQYPASSVTKGPHVQDFEKLGAFYLGKSFDPAIGAVKDDLLLYDAKDLTTHAVCVGMTGSGKTGLCISLLEEAAIDGIPAIAIDPKGDLGNILLSFPNLQPGDFRPWIDESEAARKGMSADDFAVKTAETWKTGLAQWGQDPARIQRLKDAVDMAIYTPGNTAGRPLSILRTMAAPPPAVVQDSAALRDRIMAAVSGLLGLMGVDADPVQSREHILLSNILDRAWREGRSLDIAAVIQDIQKPPFEKIGVFDLESFFPAKDRLGLAMQLNNLLASPGFSAWMEGEPLDIQRLLYTAEGKPRLSILSIAHLSDAERMFFVTVLLNEIVAWTRAQSGTSSLRALLYMDEIYGYFPPTANPPSKGPMLTLLKQARAFGLGVVLSTQNPVDLDYKGLANCGTWFLGRLQTERDKARVIEGLEGVTAGTGGSFDKAKMEQMLAGLGNRVFLMRNVHDDEPVMFQTRWALSYLRGPMTMPQIRQAMAGMAAAAPAAPVAVTSPLAASAAPPGTKPMLPADVQEFFMRPKTPGEKLVYRPYVIGMSKMHFVDAKSGVDAWVPYTHLAPVSDDGRDAQWDQASTYGDIKADLERQPAADVTFSPLPAGASSAKKFAAWKATLEDHLYQNVTLTLMACPSLKLISQAGESEGDFSARVAQALREKRDVEVEKLRKKYAPKLQVLQDRQRRAQERVEREQAQFGQQKMNTMISVGATLLGAFLGRKAVSVGSVGRATTAMKSASRIGKEKEDIARADESVQAVQERLTALQSEFDSETAAMQGPFEPSVAPVEKSRIRPRKSDISVGTVGLVWTPWRIASDGITEPAF